MFPTSLQGRFVFLFVALIFITNAFLAVAGFSRERLALADESMNAAVSVGRALQQPAKRFLLSGDVEALDNIFASRSGVMAELKLTLYDRNWWKLWGDEARIPPGGFPDIQGLVSMESHSGPGQTYRELFFPISNEDGVAGAVGVGVPAVWQEKSSESAGDFALLMLISMFLGILVAIFASRSILVPLNDLMNGIEEFGNGDYSVRVGASGSGELKSLGESFNKMALTVQETFKENQVRNRANDEKLQELWEIYELMRKVTLNVEFSEILEKFLEKAQTLSFSSYGEIILQNRRNLRFEGVVSVHNDNVINKSQLENIVNNCFINKIVSEGQDDGVSVICIPLLSGNRINGVMLLAKNDSGGYSEGVRRFLETIAPVLASIIENACLYEELSDWNQRMKNILASVSQGLAAVDYKNRFLVANERLSEIFAVKDFNFKKEGLRDFLAEMSDQEFAAALIADIANFNQRAIESEKHLAKVAKTLPYKQGESIRQISVQLFPLQQGELVKGCVIVAEDVTDQKMVEHQMLETEKWAVLGRLAASVAHEIRNPLVAIRSLIEIIGEEVQGELKEHASVILGEVLRLNRVVAELLSLVRPETATLKNCNLIELVDELMLLLRYEAARNEIRLSRNFAVNPCNVSIDPEKIKQAILNLVLNAFQAVGKGGNVELGVSRADGFAVISVSNNGPEIDDTLKGKIFEPFFTTRSNGTGLGLAITRKIAELHSGRIELDSQPGKTEFRFFVPDGVKNDQDTAS
ncbi:MAG: ATP-binding protein [Candidatus Riflebacteria bacterium]|nr:ATP-binding protein [Candidatus Riflebacteria bacterium]